MEEPDGQSFRKRSGWVIAAVIFWAALCFGSVVYFSIFNRNEYQKISLETAWRQGKIPALRGSIYASDGTVLAFSKLEFFLFWKNDKAKSAAEKIFGRSLTNGSKITGKEMTLLKEIFQKHPSEIWVETRERRTSSPGLEHIEKKYDSVLKGEDGLFVVMHDRYGRRVQGSLKIIREQIPGRTVILSQNSEEKE